MLEGQRTLRDFYDAGSGLGSSLDHKCGGCGIATVTLACLLSSAIVRNAIGSTRPGCLILGPGAENMMLGGMIPFERMPREMDPDAQG